MEYILEYGTKFEVPHEYRVVDRLANNQNTVQFDKLKETHRKC